MFQVWNVLEPQTPDQSKPTPSSGAKLPNLVFQGRVNNPFGIAILRTCDVVAAGITNSGDTLELWYLGAQTLLGHSFAQIPQSVTATALHIDEEYPDFSAFLKLFALEPQTCP